MAIILYFTCLFGVQDKLNYQNTGFESKSVLVYEFNGKSDVPQLTDICIYKRDLSQHIN